MKIRGKTRKGKNKIREAGTDEWIVIRRENHVACLRGKPGVMIAPSTEGEDERLSARSKGRWILERDDPDFEVIS